MQAIATSPNYTNLIGPIPQTLPISISLFSASFQVRGKSPAKAPEGNLGAILGHPTLWCRTRWNSMGLPTKNGFGTSFNIDNNDNNNNDKD